MTDGWIDADVLLAYLEDEDDTRVRQVWHRAELDWCATHERNKRGSRERPGSDR